MTATLKLERVMGHLTINPNAKRRNAPKFVGSVAVALYEHDDEPLARIPGVASSRIFHGEELLDVKLLGLAGTLYPAPNKQSSDDPDFVGTVGPDSEMVVSAWKWPSAHDFRGLNVELHDRSTPVHASDCLARASQAPAVLSRVGPVAQFI